MVATIYNVASKTKQIMHFNSVMIQLLFNNLIVFANSVSVRVLLQALVFLYDIPRPPWLEYHERCTAGILGLLPLVLNLSFALMIHQKAKRESRESSNIHEAFYMDGICLKRKSASAI